VRRILLAIFVLCFSLPAAAARAVILVRHAEKAAEGGDDPALSIPGEDRAITLTRFLRHNKIDAIFVTQYRRTQQTAAVLARQRQLKPVLVSADETKVLIEKIRALPKDAVALVVGHSNTLPEIIKALGVKQPIDVRDEEYGRVFVVTPTADPAVMSVLEFSY
jgi:phosphohistidine phosphatase SixA